MCFRPTSVDASVVCPGCGKKVSSLGGITLTACPFCKADLKDAQPAPDIAAPPVIPPAPPAQAPAAPKAPPSAPKAPPPLS